MSTKRVGETLRGARESRGFTIEDVAKATFINPRYLEALERGDFGALPSAVQVRGFLRTYSEYLKLNMDELVAMMHEGAPASAVNTGKQEEAIASAAKAPQDQAAIYAEIGRSIRARREMLGLSLEDVSQHTHIPEHYLALIETGAFGGFPSPVQARGMLNNYADFLSMDSSVVMLRFAEGLQARLGIRAADPTPAEEDKPAKGPRPRPQMPLWLRNTLTPDILIFGTLGLLLLFVVIWGAGKVITLQAAQQPNPTAPPLAQILLPTDTPNPEATATPTPTPEGDTGDEAETISEQPETPSEELPPVNPAAIQLYIVVRQRTYLRVTVDGEVVFDGRTLPGTNLPYSGNEQIELLTGNGAALQVFYNQQDLGPLGIFGEVVRTIFTPNGQVAPTPQPSPTINPLSITPSPTATPGDEE